MPKTQCKKEKEGFNEEAIKERMDFEAKQNLLGFFELLLKVDMRNNPERYKKTKEQNNNDNDKC